MNVTQPPFEHGAGRLPGGLRYLGGPFLFLAVTVASMAVARADSPRPVLRVVTLNIAHGRGQAASQFGIPRKTFEANLDATAAVFRREQADVVALQEADAPSAWSGSFDHVSYLAAAARYPHVHHGIHFDVALMGVQVRYGTALLARRELGSPRSYLFDVHSLNRKGFVTAEVALEGRRLLVVSVHLDSQSVWFRQKQAEQLIETLGGCSLPIVLMGDFNSRWSNPSDAVRVIADALALRSYAPRNRNHPTFPASIPRKRIDWILISPSLEFVRYRVLADRVSDHRAVTCDLRWRETP